MRALAWAGALIYVVLALSAVRLMFSGPDAALGWAIGGVVVAPGVTLVSLGMRESQRAIAIGVGLFASAFLVLNAFVAS